MTLADPPTEEVPVEFVAEVCGLPRCGCCTVEFLAPEASEAEPKSRSLPSSFWVDLNTRSLVRESNSTADPEFKRFNGIIRTQLTDANVLKLREWFFAEKVELICTTPIEEIDIKDLPDASSGLMIGFVDVFPCGLDFHFTFEGELWAVDDQHCVQTKCPCSETVLSFLKLIDRSGTPSRELRDVPSLRYNYATQKTEALLDRAATGPAPIELFGALKASIPTFDDGLQLRHLILQTLYNRQEINRALSQISSLIAAHRPKVGRNDPCPCGSGRKFKHCCLNKPTPSPGRLGEAGQ